MTHDTPNETHVEADDRPEAAPTDAGRFLPGTGIEIVRERPVRGRYRHVLFDFDGTLSLIREGWPQVMIPMMVEILLETPRHEPEEALYGIVEDFVMRLNGKQTIYQMMQLADEVATRGGRPREPLAYKAMYHERLMERIRQTPRPAKACSCPDRSTSSTPLPRAASPCTWRAAPTATT